MPEGRAYRLPAALSIASLRTDRLSRFALVLVIVVFSALLWAGLPKLGHVLWAYDDTEFERYAQILDSQGRLPTRTENYEFALPPGVPAVAVGLQRAARWVGPVDVRPFPSLPREWRIGIWALIAVGAGWFLAVGRRRRTRAVGWALAVVASSVLVLQVISAATAIPWVPELLPEAVSAVGLLVISALLARELWPDEPWLAPAAALATACIPMVFRMGLVFSPDPPFALVAGLALLLTVRARRTGWSLSAGAIVGLLLGLLAWIRPSAPDVMIALAVAALVIGRRAAVRFVAAGAVVVALVAGPWWGYQGAKYGNPLQSNLDRPGYMLKREPLSFFTEVPTEVITNPWRVLSRNDLFPKFHVALWSDWTGIGDFGGPYGADQKALASSQSVLGFGADALVLGGLLGLGIPALLYALRRRPLSAEQAGLTTLTTLFVLTWGAFLAMLLRFPQHDGDPNSPHYLLFLSPAAALFAIAAIRALHRRGWRRVALGWFALYLASWAMVLGVMV